MNKSTFLLLGILIAVLFYTRQLFLVSVAGLLVLFYAVALTSRSMGKGAKRIVQKGKSVYAGELKEMEGFTGKYPAKFFDSAGKAFVEKINDHQAPKGAKNYRDAQNYRWEIKDPMGKLADSANKILESLGKLFSR